MAEITRAPVARVGVDLSKRVYQVHAVDAQERAVFAKTPAGGSLLCTVRRVASGLHRGHGDLRRRAPCDPYLRHMGPDARLIAGHFVSPYRMAGKSGKNDANDAAAICESAGRPHMRFVLIKTTGQQGQLAVHRLREGFQQEPTALINPIRGLLAEFGLVFAQGPDALCLVLASVIEDASDEIAGVARLAL